MVLLAIGISGCVDHEVEKFKVNKPESIALQEEIDSYDALKSYVNRDQNPNFKLGAGASLSDYMAKGVMYRLLNRNFDEITLGYEMKHGAVVQDDGTLNLGNVEGLLEEAAAAGLTVYGHTLAWHANQNATYLNERIADVEIETDPDDANNSLHINNPTAGEAVWDAQVFYDLPTPLTEGVEYTLKLRVKASSSTTVAFWRTDGTDTNYGPDFSAGESWSDATVTFTPSINATTLQFNFGTFAGDLYFDDMVLTASGSEDNLIANGNFDSEILEGWEKPGWHTHTFMVAPVAAGPSSWWTNLVTNSDVENDDVSSFFATEIKDGPNPATIGAPGTGADGVGRAIVVQSGDNPDEEWDTQFFVKAPQQLQEGQAYRFSMMIKADKAATISSQAHNNPGGYVHYEMVGSPNVTTEWKEYTHSGIISGSQAGAAGMNTIAFNLAILGEANTYYFDDIVWEIEEVSEGNKRPLTPEEKKEIISEEFERWIAGMLEVSKDYVKAWDVLNEPMDDGNPYELKTGVGRDLAADEFYWQDYLGKDYVVEAFRLAREYGNPGDIHFINDYNLEYNLDKCKGIIQLVEYIEDKGETVHGIGTQMHIDINSDKEKIAEMFELLAATGKLIKISELDIGLGGVTTNQATAEQYQAQANMYKYVVEKYFEIIPPSQRYGITIWSPTDSPAGSFWRAGEPIGLWTEGLVRKLAYTGVADGLEEAQ